MDTRKVMEGMAAKLALIRMHVDQVDHEVKEVNREIKAMTKLMVVWRSRNPEFTVNTFRDHLKRKKLGEAHDG